MRTPLATSVPEGYRKVNALDLYVSNNLEPSLKDLVYLRDLLSDGFPLCKVFAVTTWRESSFFTPRERLALELSEAMTDIAHGVSDDLWQRVSAAFSDKEVGDLVLAISMINVWNRISISTRLQPEPLDEPVAASA